MKNTVAAGLDRVVYELRKNPYGLLYTDIQRICKEYEGIKNENRRCMA